MTASDNAFLRGQCCPICNGNRLQLLASFGDVPVSGIFLAESRSIVPTRQLVFAYCPVCACVAQHRDTSPSIDYTMVARSTSRQSPAYADKLIDRLLQEKKETDSLLVEVGCNDGTFLNELRNAGFDRRVGIEPSRMLADAARAAGHEIFAEGLDATTAAAIVDRYGLADMLVCRHTLEHVPSPVAFLGALRALLVPGGLACVEVPSLAPIIGRLHVQELWDEHLTYFLPANLGMAIGAAGLVLESIAVEPHRGMENIVAWVRRSEVPLSQPSCAADDTSISLCASFNIRWQATAKRLREALAQQPGPRVILGASHPQANFINYFGLAPLVDAAIDDDPAKIGRWLPLIGKAVAIYPSAELAQRVTGGTLLLSAFGYPEWTMNARQAASGHAAAVFDVSNVLQE